MRVGRIKGNRDGFRENPDDLSEGARNDQNMYIKACFHRLCKKFEAVYNPTIFMIMKVSEWSIFFPVK